MHSNASLTMAVTSLPASYKPGFSLASLDSQSEQSRLESESKPSSSKRAHSIQSDSSSGLLPLNSIAASLFQQGAAIIPYLSDSCFCRTIAKFNNAPIRFEPWLSRSA